MSAPVELPKPPAEAFIRIFTGSGLTEAEFSALMSMAEQRGISWEAVVSEALREKAEKVRNSTAAAA